ncbi:hypothetical protein GQF36_09175 [Neisseria meningitidis]|nr:hypothetical protein [Neisseria meningitidis]
MDCRLNKKIYIKINVYSGLNLNQDKATKPQTVQIVRQGEATPYWFEFNPLYLKPTLGLIKWSDIHIRQPIFFSDGISSQQPRQYPLIHR